MPVYGDRYYFVHGYPNSVDSLSEYGYYHSIESKTEIAMTDRESTLAPYPNRIDTALQIADLDGNETQDIPCLIGWDHDGDGWDWRAEMLIGSVWVPVPDAWVPINSHIDSLVQAAAEKDRADGLRDYQESIDSFGCAA